MEAGIGGLQNGMHRIEFGVADKIHQLEETINRMFEALLSKKEVFNGNNNSPERHSCTNKEEPEGSHQIFSSEMAKLEFPRYSGDDPIEWLNQVDQFFEYQGMLEM